jgi:hypothetical protein
MTAAWFGGTPCPARPFQVTVQSLSTSQAVTIVGDSLANHPMLRVYDLRFAEAMARRGFNSDQDTPQYAPKR